MVAVGGLLVVTVSVALLLVALPKLLLTTARKVAPSSARVTLEMVKLCPVAPGMFTPPRCHWNASGGAPEAVTENVAEPPTGTVWLTGWVVMRGAWLAVNSTR